ncbi:MAG: HIT family protein [Candidatus Lokiarchaeota archaeon]|nr:HIT family protein [Candidatus Harpocratesius repetitus]
METDCIFCKIVKKEIPARIIYESNFSVAILDIAPATRGHTVVIPKKHFYNLIDMPKDIMGGFFEDIQKVSKLIMEKLKVKGFNLIQNNFEVAGQIVPHAHFHIVPRYENDNFPQFKKDPIQATSDKLDAIFKLFT